MSAARALDPAAVAIALLAMIAAVGAVAVGAAGWLALAGVGLGLIAVLQSTRGWSRSWRWFAVVAAAGACAGGVALRRPPAGSAEAGRHPATVAAVAASDAERLARRADDGRRFGAPTAPCVLELAMSIECSHCADAWSRIRPGLAGELESGRIELVVRPTVRVRAPSSRALASWALASAAQGRDRFAAYLEAMGGARADFPPERHLRGPAASDLGLPALAAEVAAHAAVYDGCIDADARRLAELRVGGLVPQAVLLDRAGNELGRWVGRIDPRAIIAAARQAAGRPGASHEGAAPR